MKKINDYPSRIPNWDKAGNKKEQSRLLKEIGALQYKMYAQQKHSLLLVFQGLDASGKDGLVRKLFKYTLPASVAVKSFKKPTPEEYAHDFLWRVHQHSPKKGHIQVFIRSHYEDILVPTVEGFLPAAYVEERYALINQFEQLLAHNGTTILKFFLNVSLKEQEERLRERLINPEKHWKHNDGDWDTRKKFDKYLQVYEQIINRCQDVPWHVIPADSNSQKLHSVSKIVHEALSKMDLTWPELETEFTDLQNPG